MNLHKPSLARNHLTDITKDFFSDLTPADEFRENNSFQILQNLNHLDLNDNEISYVEPGAFDNLRNLRYLYLKGNNI